MGAAAEARGRQDTATCSQ